MFSFGRFSCSLSELNKKNITESTNGSHDWASSRYRTFYAHIPDNICSVNWYNDSRNKKANFKDPFIIKGALNPIYRKLETYIFYIMGQIFNSKMCRIYWEMEAPTSTFNNCCHQKSVPSASDVSDWLVCDKRRVLHHDYKTLEKRLAIIQ